MHDDNSYRDDATQWVNNLDRTLLGTTAVPTTHLIASRSLEMYVSTGMIKSNNFDPILDSLLDYSLAAFGDAMKSMSHNIPAVARAMAEMFFWHFKQYPDDEDFRNHFMEDKIPTVGGLKEAFALVNHVYDNPDKLSFFELGIWDHVIIEKFIADGIDAHLAEQLLFTK